MNSQISKIFSFLVIFLMLTSCGKGFLKGGDARKNPPDPRERVKKNLEEGRGFRLNNALNKGLKGGGNFEFASSNELWRASLDVIDFIPLVSANYSGGIIITDWYSENQNESIKITVRFMSNEIRSDSIIVKVFYKKCNTVMNCEVTEKAGTIQKEIKREILKKAAIYKKQSKDKKFKPYSNDLDQISR